MAGWLSTEDLFVAGGGFDIAGAVLLGRGLVVTPFQARRRTGMYIGWNRADLAASANDCADGIVGISSLVTGFALQATAYIAAVAGVAQVTSSISRALAAVVLLLVALAIPVGARRWLGWAIMRRFIVGMARVRINDDGASQTDAADGRILELVGSELGHPRLASELGEDGLRAYAARVFGLAADEVVPVRTDE